MKMDLLKKWVTSARVPIGMLAVQLIATGVQLLSRLILTQGTFIYALITYRLLIAAISIAPFALYWERGIVNKLNFLVFFWLFMVALTGIIGAMGLFYYGLKYTTATYATNFLNLVPVITFLFSIILRIEKLGLKTRGGQVKSIGAMLCLGGALTVALYKGKSLYINHNHGHEINMYKADQNWSRGTIFLVASCLAYAMWFILQVKVYKVFPYKYWSCTIMCIIASAQAAVIGVSIDRKRESWYLAWNLQLLTICYSGILATGASFCLVSWTIAQKGPTYPSMFNPLSLILITLLEALFFAEPITVGSLIGMSLIMVGLYSFLWGKNKDIPPIKSEGESTEATIIATSPSPINNQQSSSH